MLLDLGKLSQSRFQKIDIIVPDTSPVGSYQATVQLDRQFNRIIGIAYFERADGGINQLYNVGAKTDRQVWVDPIAYHAWQADQGVGPMYKYFSVDIEYASGDTFYMIVNTLDVLTADLIGQMVLVLSKDNTAVPR